ncbi:MAG: DUF2474 family protein [Sphingomonas sp.]
MVAPDAGPLWKRLVWLAAIWAMSVASLAAIALVLRWWLRA